MISICKLNFKNSTVLQEKGFLDLRINIQITYSYKAIITEKKKISQRGTLLLKTCPSEEEEERKNLKKKSFKFNNIRQHPNERRTEK